MAKDLLKLRGLAFEVPCTCMVLEGDNELCPRHYVKAEVRVKNAELKIVEEGS